MSAETKPADLDEHIVRRLRVAGVDPAYANFVRQHLHDPTDGWRWCCGSNCDPCAVTLARVVDEVRAGLGGERGASAGA